MLGFSPIEAALEGLKFLNKLGRNCTRFEISARDVDHGSIISARVPRQKHHKEAFFMRRG